MARPTSSWPGQGLACTSPPRAPLLARRVRRSLQKEEGDLNGQAAGRASQRTSRRRWHAKGEGYYSSSACRAASSRTQAHHRPAVQEKMTSQENIVFAVLPFASAKSGRRESRPRSSLRSGRLQPHILKSRVRPSSARTGRSASTRPSSIPGPRDKDVRSSGWRFAACGRGTHLCGVSTPHGMAEYRRPHGHAGHRDHARTPGRPSGRGLHPVLSAIEMREVAEPFIRGGPPPHGEKRVAIFAAGPATPTFDDTPRPSGPGVKARSSSRGQGRRIYPPPGQEPRAKKVHASLYSEACEGAEGQDTTAISLAWTTAFHPRYDMKRKGNLPARPGREDGTL